MNTEPARPIKGRGTPIRIAHRYEAVQREAVDDGWAREPEDGEPPPPRTEVREERVRSILSANDSPDVPFEWSVNPYRGCEHGCSYCYARPGHA
ncbi:MAG TPA: radical SAM protein, partial [Methylibium sp.]|nr:radical SAM protein [Methylibium sp.]